MQLLEAKFTVESNNKFHTLSEKVKEEYGALDSERIYARWNEWLKKEAKDQIKNS